LDEEVLWATWKRLVRLLPVWRMPYEFFASPSIWSLFGVDFLSGLRRNRSSKLIFEVLAPLAAGDLRRVLGLAEINHRRQDIVSRWTAVAFVTLPASAVLTASQLSPETVQAVADLEGFARWYLMLAYVGVAVVYYQMCAWRARQLLTLIQMHCIDRGVAERGADGEAEEPFKEPMGA
jgi:hypothetical protein